MTSRLSIPTFVAGWLLACAVFLSTPALAEEAWQERLAEGELLLSDGEAKKAIPVLREAKKLSPGPCGECELNLARAFLALGAFKNVRDAAGAATELLTDPAQKARAYNLLGFGEYQAGKAKEEGLRRAVEAFRQAARTSEESAPTAYFGLGSVLMQLGEDEEGTEVLRRYLDSGATGPMAERARSLIDNPERARRSLMPEFEVVTLDGEYLTSEELRGKVILLDFWATWCAPCVDALPWLSRMSKKSDKNPFVLLSISADSSEDILRAFLDENPCDWTQVWDENMALSSNQFRITGYPTYMVVDHTGEVVFRISGGGPSIEAQVSSQVSAAIRKARKARKSK